jgi:glycosyltransferase involved in cell wall biosynthesis
MERARAIVVISRFEQDYIQTHSPLTPILLHLPVYGQGPFPDLSNPTAGFVTIINPCDLKGLPIFVELTRRFPDIAFAAVPTWGSSDTVLKALQGLPNVAILPHSDDIQQILAQTRVLLVPSLWPETFGYVVPEAMLRGIPVLASRVGGLPEAKLGVDYVIDVAPGQWRDGLFVVPPQPLDPWARALAELTTNSDHYRRVSLQSRLAADAFVRGVTACPIVDLARQVAESN